MPTLTMPLAQMQQALDAVAPYQSKDDVTPIIMAVCAAPAGTGVRLTTTDRYTVGDFVVSDAELDDPDDVLNRTTGAVERQQMLIPSLAAAFIRTVTQRQLIHPVMSYSVLIDAPAQHPGRLGAPIDPTDTPGAAVDKGSRITVSILESETGAVEMSRVFEAVLGAFPPVARLFPDHEPVVGITKVRLSPKFLERLARSERAIHGRYASGAGVSLTFWEPDNGSTKPKPVQVDFDDATLRVLIQPYAPIR